MTTPDLVTRERQRPRETPETLNFIPPLENGDQFTRDEFERRYEAMPHIKKAELIEGVVYMPSPVRVSHGRPHGTILHAMLNHDLVKVLSALQTGLASDDHAAFVKRLAGN